MTPWQAIWYLLAILLLVIAGILTLAKVNGRVPSALVMFAAASAILAFAWPGLAGLS